MTDTRSLVVHSVLAIDLLLWLGIAALLVAGRGNSEEWLETASGASVHRDTFEHIDQVLCTVWMVQSVHAILAVSAGCPAQKGRLGRPGDRPDCRPRRSCHERRLVRSELVRDYWNLCDRMARRGCDRRGVLDR